MIIEIFRWITIYKAGYIRHRTSKGLDPASSSAAEQKQTLFAIEWTEAVQRQPQRPHRLAVPVLLLGIEPKAYPLKSPEIPTARSKARQLLPSDCGASEASNKSFSRRSRAADKTPVLSAPCWYIPE